MGQTKIRLCPVSIDLCGRPFYGISSLFIPNCIDSAMAYLF